AEYRSRPSVSLARLLAAQVRQRPRLQPRLGRTRPSSLVGPSLDAATGFLYSLSNTLARLGDRRAVFETEARTALADADTWSIAVRLTDSALIGRRPFD